MTTRPNDATRAAPAAVRARAVRLDRTARRVWLDGTEIQLTGRQYDLLTLLVTNAGKVVTRAQIMRDVLGANWWPNTKLVDIHVGRLRAGLGDDPAAPTYITTVRGHGYRWDGPLDRPEVDADELAQFLRDTTPAPDEWAATAPLVPVAAWAAAILDHFEVRRRGCVTGDAFQTYRPAIVDVPVAEGLL